MKDRALARAFQMQERMLVGHTPKSRISTQSRTSHNTVTGDQDGDRIRPHGTTNRSGRAPNLGRDIGIGPRLPIGNPAQRVPDLLAVRSPVRTVGQGLEIDRFPVKIALQKVACFQKEQSLLLIAPPTPVQSDDLALIFTDGKGPER